MSEGGWGQFFTYNYSIPIQGILVKRFWQNPTRKKVIGEKTTFRYVKVTFKGGRGRSKGGGVGKGMSEGAGVGGWGRGGGDEGEEEVVRERGRDEKKGGGGRRTSFLAIFSKGCIVLKPSL